MQAVIERSLASSKDRGAALRQAAAKEPDPQKRQDLLGQAQYYDQLAAHLAEIAAQAKNETGINTSELFNQKPEGAPLNVTPPRNPMPTYPGAAPAAPSQTISVPQAAPSASAAKLAVPQGRVLVRNVRTGAMGHIPQEQLDQAMKDGYEMMR